jgi:hypothetical protein
MQRPYTKGTFASTPYRSYLFQFSEWWCFLRQRITAIVASVFFLPDASTFFSSCFQVRQHKWKHIVDVIVEQERRGMFMNTFQKTTRPRYNQLNYPTNILKKLKATLYSNLWRNKILRFILLGRTWRIRLFMWKPWIKQTLGKRWRNHLGWPWSLLVL